MVPQPLYMTIFQMLIAHMAIVELNHPLQMKHVKVHPMNLILTS